MNLESPSFRFTYSQVYRIRWGTAGVRLFRLAEVQVWGYLRDCIAIFDEYGWDWTYHAFREWPGWSVEHEGDDIGHMAPSADNPRKRALLDGFAR